MSRNLSRLLFLEISVSDPHQNDADPVRIRILGSASANADPDPDPGSWILLFEDFHMMAIMINTLTNCSLTNYSLRKEIFKEEIKTEKGLETFFFSSLFSILIPKYYKKWLIFVFFNHDADPDPDPAK